MADDELGTFIGSDKVAGTHRMANGPGTSSVS